VDYISQRMRQYDDSIVYLDGRPIKDFVWADALAGRVMEIIGKGQRELRTGQVKIVLNVGSSR
jgi:hypothetical protein